MIYEKPISVVDETLPFGPDSWETPDMDIYQ